MLLRKIDGTQDTGAVPATRSPHRLWHLIMVVFACYSVALLSIELSTSQEYVRTFFTDIGQPHKHGFFARADGHWAYAINTSLSAFLLGCAGMLLLFSCFAFGQPSDDQAVLFTGQALVLLYVGADDRFMLHERLGSMLDIRSSVVLGAVVALNGLLYFYRFRFRHFSRAMAWSFAIAGVLFFIMMVIDVLLPHKMPGRLSIEDLTKVWAALFFLRFAWQAAHFRITGGGASAQEDWMPPELMRLVPAMLRERFSR